MCFTFFEESSLFSGEKVLGLRVLGSGGWDPCLDQSLGRGHVLISDSVGFKNPFQQGFPACGRAPSMSFQQSQPARLVFVRCLDHTYRECLLVGPDPGCVLSCLAGFSFFFCGEGDR